MRYFRRTATWGGRLARRAWVPAAVILLFLPAPPAEAQEEDGFTCRASVVRIEGEGPFAGQRIEPFVANEQEDPCTEDNAGLLASDLPGGLGHANLVFASTDVADDAAAAEAGVLNLRLQGPAGSPFEGHFIEVSVLTSQAAVTCAGKQPDFSGSSQVIGVNVDGTPIAVPPGNAHFEVPLGPLGTLHLNEQTETGNQLTQQAVFLDTPLGNVIIAEAIVDTHGNPCAGDDDNGGGGNGGDPPDCSDELDNDGDGFIDWPNDPGCDSPQDDDETDNETPECSDGEDNDMDGHVDYPADPGCESRDDDDESDGDEPECDDGVDNDQDGRVDYPADDGCKSAEDDDEAAGFMTGGGGYDEVDRKTLNEDYVNPGTFLRYGTALPCDIGDPPGPSLTVTWHDPGLQGRFKLDTLTRAFCRNDPEISPGGPPAEHDTYVGEGNGQFTNALGMAVPARAEFIVIDRGEPGAPPVIGIDFFSIRVTDPTGSIVLAEGVGTLDQGNNQAHTPGSPKARTR